ncbi:thermonuclease family protein [Albibacillus kandeliae]
MAGAAAADPAGKIRVVDADTWDVGGARVRLFGVDAPEQDQHCTRQDGRDWACGAWATEQVRTLYQGRRAACREVNIDRYGRIVARCEVEGADVGRELVTRGLALAYRRYSMDYDLDEKSAHVARRGLHAAQVQAPSDFRAAKRSAATLQPLPEGSDCRIKGNISSKGVRIYHVPGQENYNATRISPSKGERWFCSEAAARAAGWRRAKR